MAVTKADLQAYKDLVEELTKPKLEAAVLELLKVTKAKRNKGESAVDFTTRVTEKSEKLSEALWAGLSNEAQLLVNLNLSALALEQPEELSLLAEEDQEAEAEEGDEAPAEAEAEATTQQEDEVVSNGKSTSKKKAPAAKAKKAVAAKSSKPAKAAKVAKPAKKAGEGQGPGRKGTYALDAKIKLLAKENPKRKGSAAAKRFDKYTDGKTVAELLKAGLNWSDLRWDEKHEHIRIG